MWLGRIMWRIPFVVWFFLVGFLIGDSWSASLPAESSASSAASVCGFPGAPAHSSVSFSSETLRQGTVATYACERGFELLGPARRVCEEDGRWTPDGIPFCVLNVAAGKAPMQSSVASGGIPQKAVDGSTSSFFNPGTCTMTEPEPAPWWYVNLLEPYMVQLVRLDFGQPCCGGQQATVVVRAGNTRPDLGVNPICNKFSGSLEAGKPLFLPCNPPIPSAFVSVHLEGPPGSILSLCEAFVYTDQALPIERCPHFRDQPPGSTATYNDKCYVFYDQQPMRFGEAKQFCESRSGTLVDDINPARQGFLSWELWRRHRGDPANGQYWMGAFRNPQNPTAWKWISGQDVTISFWNLPGGAENCARFDGNKGWLWSDTNCNLQLNFICQHRPTTCGSPEQPPNSTMAAPNFDVTSTVEYHCNAGHVLVGPATRTCQANGFFSEFPPVCRYLECGLPAEVPNGHMQLVNNTREYMSIVRYTCDKGYTLVGRSELMCDVDEKWNGPPPKCEPVYCPEPPQIPHGAVSLSTNSTVAGTIVEYSCADANYVLIGDPRIVCQNDGTYDKEAPLCKADARRKNNQDGPIPLPPSASNPPLAWPPPHLKPDLHDITDQTSPSVVDDVPNSVYIKNGSPPNVDVPSTLEEDDAREGSSISGAKLNLGGIIALGVFGGFVFLAAIITTIVILVRRNNSNRHYRRRNSPDSHTITSVDSSGSESHQGLNKYYRKAWEHLHETASRSALRQHLAESEGKPSSTGLNNGHHHHHHHHHHNNHHHQPVSRKETLDEPNYRSSRGSEVVRDGTELIVSDANYPMNKTQAGGSRKHHHHHGQGASTSRHAADLESDHDWQGRYRNRH